MKRLLKPDKYQLMISISAIGEVIARRATLNSNCSEFVTGRSGKNISKRKKVKENDNEQWESFSNKKNDFSNKKNGFAHRKDDFSNRENGFGNRKHDFSDRKNNFSNTKGSFFKLNH